MFRNVDSVTLSRYSFRLY